jgi:hypothetical protein
VPSHVGVAEGLRMTACPGSSFPSMFDESSEELEDRLLL